MKCMTQVEKPETLEKVLLIESDSLHHQKGVGRFFIYVVSSNELVDQQADLHETLNKPNQGDKSG